MNQRQRFEHASNFLRAGNPQSAATVCERSLEKYPGDANLLCLLAKANLAMKRFGEVRPHLEEAIRLFPDFAGAHETFGDFFLVRGRAAEARKAYEQAMRLDPARAPIHDKIARAAELETQQRETASNRLPAKRRMAFADDIKKAAEYERDGDPKRAELVYRDILTRDPDHVEAARLLAKVAFANDQYGDAEILLKKALSNAPDYTRAWVDLVEVYRKIDRHVDAVEAARRVLELSPDKAESYILFAGAVGPAGDHDEAIRAYEKALSISPDRAGVLCGMAHHQKTIGEEVAAIASYRKAIAMKPDHAESYWSLANLKTFRFTAGEVGAMEALLERDDLPDESRSQLHNALGLEYEAQGEYGTAFSNFEKCNAIRRRSEKYDPVDTEATCSRLINLFDRDYLSRKAGAPPTGVTPILIVGLPRSGSTLIEQILASHSQVDGTHELGDLARVIHATGRRKRNRQAFPERLAELEPDEWAGIGERYLQRTRIYRGTAPFFVDKNPNNFLYAGVLKLAIPNAKIIDARRHPLDSCFGSFKQLFASGQPFSYDLTELGEYYVQYRRLMDHWHEVLPGFVLEVNYEEVVLDLDEQVRRILDFCGLPFEEACLRFHETRRAVKTASSQQVRRPIYATSVNLWRNYEAQLAPLVHILEPLLAALPPADRPEGLAEKHD